MRKGWVFASRRSALCRTEQQTLILAVTTKKGVIHCKKNKKNQLNTLTQTQQHKNTHMHSHSNAWVHTRTHTCLNPLHLPNDLNTSGPAYFPSKYTVLFCVSKARHILTNTTSREPVETDRNKMLNLSFVISVFFLYPNSYTSVSHAKRMI